MSYTTTTLTFQGIDFVANFSSENEKSLADEMVREVLCRAGLENKFTLKEHRSIDWSQEVGERVALKMVRIPNHAKYAAVIRLEDETYMEHYSDFMELANGTSVRWSNKHRGWLIRPEDFMEAWYTIEDLKDVKIPMEDTLEWEAFHDKSNERILFFPYFPGCVGEPKQGDHWAGIGDWDDVTRSFVFTEEDWDYYMTFFGYSVHT
jgi:hypothetical protein